MHNKQKEIAATFMYKIGRAFYQRAAYKGDMALKQQEALKLCRAASTMKKQISLDKLAVTASIQEDHAL